MLRALVFAAVCLAAPLSVEAQQVTKKFDYKPVAGIQAITFGLDKVKISQIVFRVASPPGASARRSPSEAVMRVDNEGSIPVAVGLAIAVMDEDGNLVAAGSGGTRGAWLTAGDRDTAAIKFPFVYRNLSKAKTFVLTMEVEPRPGSVTPTPSP